MVLRPVRKGRKAEKGSYKSVPESSPPKTHIFWKKLVAWREAL